jgi:hypothetical protein
MQTPLSFLSLSLSLCLHSPLSPPSPNRLNLLPSVQRGVEFLDSAAGFKNRRKYYLLNMSALYF